MLPESTLRDTSMMVARQLGLDFPQNRWKDLEQAIVLTARELGIKETDKDISAWLSGYSLPPAGLEVLSTYLTVGETYFFREKTGLDAFQKYIIPEIIKEREGKEQYLRIWSAGCCTGEEPYTLAILLKEMIPDIHKWSITILATDTNAIFLKKAQKGIYSSWSFRETPQSVKDQYFLPIGKDWEIIPEIRKMVTFSSLNLAWDEYPSMITNTNAIDVIFCRNVLMYFTPGQIRLAGQRFHRSLTERGWLITSSVELNDDYFSEFAAVSVEKGIFYRKIPKEARKYSPTNVGLTFPKQPFPNLSATRKPYPKQTIPSKQTNSSGLKKSSDSKTAESKFSMRNGSPSNEVELLFEKGYYQECIEQCLASVKSAPSDNHIIIFLVKSYANLGKLDEAVRWCETLLSLNGTGADSQYLYATILIEKNEPEIAESILKRALYLDPHHLLSHFLMGTIANRLGRKRVAAKHFNNVKDLLSTFHEDEVVPGSEGLTAGRMKELIDILA